MRDKLIKLLKNTEIAKINGHIALAETCFTPHVFENMADYLIAHGVTVQEWISVKDRLPEALINKVLVHCKNGYVGFGHYENFFGNATWYNLENDKPFGEWDLESCEVTHWMPLPQPPKMEVE